MEIPRVNAKIALLIFVVFTVLCIAFYTVTSEPIDIPNEDTDPSSQHLRHQNGQKLEYSEIPIPRKHPSNLMCGSINEKRYEHLAGENKVKGETPIQFFFALDIDDALDTMHTLFLAISKTITHLGPERCALSIIGSPNKKGTWNYMEAVVKHLEKLGVKTFFKGSVIDSRGSKMSRIGKLAKLRNMAIEPIYDLYKEGKISTNTTILFSNDISVCPNDMLELIHQHRFQEADLLCGLDWNNKDIFYDTWIARTIKGELFIDAEPNTDWVENGELFWNDAQTKARYDRREPFQVFSCWNGMIAVSPKPFLTSNVRFRDRKNMNECEGGEPFYLAKDFWWNGYTKIGIIPTINVAYNDQDTTETRNKHGTADGLRTKDAKIAWSKTPPKTLNCPGPHWEHVFVPWDQELGVKTINA